MFSPSHTITPNFLHPQLAATQRFMHVLRYVDFDIEQIWKTFPEFSDPTKTYLQFKAAILVHYPDASGDYVYSLRDMD